MNEEELKKKLKRKKKRTEEKNEEFDENQFLSNFGNYLKSEQSLKLPSKGNSLT